MNRRYLLKKNNCPFCAKWAGIIEKLNLSLPPDKKIIIKHTTRHERFGIETDQNLNEIKWEGTPHFYIDGINYSGATTSEGVKSFLRGVLKFKKEI